MDLIYLDESGLYICRLCMFHGKGETCYHLAPMMRRHNRRVQRERRERAGTSEKQSQGT